MTKLTSKRGEHYTLVDNTTIQVSLDKVAHPSAIYSATWFCLRSERGAVRFCFGQHVDDVMFSRVDVRVSSDHFARLLSENQSFYDKLFESGDAAEAGDWNLSRTVPPEGKYLIEDASMVSMAYSGEQAEISFYQIPSSDIWLAQIGSKERYRGPRPVVTIALLTSQLRWVITEAFGHAAQGGR